MLFNKNEFKNSKLKHVIGVIEDRLNIWTREYPRWSRRIVVKWNFKKPKIRENKYLNKQWKLCYFIRKQNFKIRK